jgi:hypothetical protein
MLRAVLKCCLIGTFVLLALNPFLSAYCKRVEIRCRFDDGGKMPDNVRIKLEVKQGNQILCFGNDSLQHRFIKCVLEAADTAPALNLTVETIKADEWLVVPSECPVPTDPVVPRSFLIIHRTSVLNAQLDTAESVKPETVQQARQALEEAKPLLRVSAERARWALAQDKVLEASGADPAIRQAAFSQAIEYVNTANLPRAESLVLAQQNFDLLKAAIAMTTSAATLTDAIQNDSAPLASGNDPKEELKIIAAQAAIATGKPSLKKAAANIDAGSSKAVRDVARSLHRGIGF